MVDLSNVIGQGSPGKAVEAYYYASQEQRGYLGLSECGHECKRFLWYRHHGYPSAQIDGRALRLFQLGNNIEDQAVKDLRSAGFMVTCRQKEVEFTFNGITLRGHIDGVIEGLVESSKPHLLEIKSANDKEFKRLLKCGSYMKWHPKYYAQIHVYAMELELKRILAYVECKDDSRIYTERIKTNTEYAVNLLQDVFEAISKPEPPERNCPSPSWYIAKWCDFSEICFAECRTRGG